MAFQLQKFSSLSMVIDAVMGMGRGEQNNVGRFTLAAGAAQTIVSFVNCAPGKTVTFSPMTANAAAALPTTYIPEATILSGSFTVRHASNAQTDRTFMYEVTGGG